jgi:serine/threonine protein kinase/tetratricopeptide (TPR) repeat protein
MPLFGLSASTEVKETPGEAVEISLTKTSICFSQEQYSMGVSMLQQLISSQAVPQSQIIKVKEKLAYGLEMDKRPEDAMRVYEEILRHQKERGAICQSSRLSILKSMESLATQTEDLVILQGRTSREIQLRNLTENKVRDWKSGGGRNRSPGITNQLKRWMGSLSALRVPKFSTFDFRATKEMFDKIILRKPTLSITERWVNYVNDGMVQAHHFYWRGQYGDQIDLLMNLLATSKGQLEPKCRERLLLKEKVASAYERSGNLKEAADFYEELLSDLRTANAGGWKLHSIVNHLAGIHERMANYDRAIELYQEDLELYKGLPRSDMGRHRVMALDLAQLILNKGGNRHRASQVMIDILMEATSNPNPDLGHIINLGLVYLRENQLGDAEKCFRIALPMAEKSFGLCHPSTIDIVQHLASSLLKKTKAKDEAERYELYLRAWAVRNINLGPFHNDTLESLHDLGHCSTKLNRRDDACHLLHSAFLGRQSRLGVAHGDTKDTISLLRKLQANSESLKSLTAWDRDWVKLRYGRIHYEHEYIWTISDHVACLDHSPTQLPQLQKILDQVIKEQEQAFGPESEKKPEYFRALSAISQCYYLQGKRDKAEFFSRRCYELQGLVDKAEKSGKMVSTNSQSAIGKAHSTLLRMCDLSIILSRSSTVQAAASAQELSQAAFFGLLELYGPSSYELEACKIRLDKFGLLRWNFEFDTEDKIPFEILGIIGKGVSGVVHAVSWRGRSTQRFAQKLFQVPKDKRRDSTMKAIDNEIEAIQMFKGNRHVVQIEYTYRVHNGYAIIMSPLAEEDLQSFLERQHTLQSSAINAKTIGMMRSWFLCLASTLASIHSRRVRHKDIKPRNILISNGSVLFADFGSSSLFVSELTSSTEGTVGGGNTRLYSPPEVMSEGRRGRSADVFSLGCVFSEIATVIAGKTIADFHKFRTTRYQDEGGELVETRMYQKSLDKVDDWFQGLLTQPEYEAFIKPMLAADREERPTAAEVGRSIMAFYGSKLSGVNTCGTCELIFSKIGWLDLIFAGIEIEAGVEDADQGSSLPIRPRRSYRGALLNSTTRPVRPLGEPE